MNTVGVVGLGLIGGSFAKAYHAAGWTVYASNRTKSILDFAILSGDVNDVLTKDNVKDCDLLLLTIYPEASIRALEEFAPFIGERPIVIDCCGTKRVVCEACFPIAEKYGFTYIDVNNGLTDETGNLKREFCKDGIHMYADAYDVVYRNLEKYL